MVYGFVNQFGGHVTIVGHGTNSISIFPAQTAAMAKYLHMQKVLPIRMRWRLFSSSRTTSVSAD